MESYSVATIISCIPDDKVYVYSSKTENPFSNINKDMVGRLESIDQKINEDWMGAKYLEYTASVRMKSGELIIIKDYYSKPWFRKYEFITLKDLQENYNIEIAK